MDFKWLTQNKIILLFIIIVFVVFTIGYLHFEGDSSLIENYGGPIKNVQKLPKGVCKNICQQYFDHCVSQPSIKISGDYGFCMNQYNLCKAECDYSNYQRM